MFLKNMLGPKRSGADKKGLSMIVAWEAYLHEVASCDCLADVAVVVLGPEVCALHLHPHTSADTHLYTAFAQHVHNQRGGSSDGVNVLQCESEAA